jgi:hypothetical protein
LIKIIIKTFVHDNHDNQTDSILPHATVALTNKRVQVKLSKAYPPFT